MLKAAHPGGLIPPILHPSPLNRENTGERTDRTGALLFAGAVASFGLALVLIGAAVSFAAGAPAPANLDQSTLVFGSLAAACALAALGMMLALRERSLRTQQMRRVTRAEQIQGELDSLGLTPKEMPIAKLILQHQSYATIAAERHLAVRTVQFHATKISSGRPMSAIGAISSVSSWPTSATTTGATAAGAAPPSAPRTNGAAVATLPAAAATKRHRPTAEAPRAPDAPSAAKIPACPGAAPTTRRRASPRKTLAASKSAEIPTVPLAAPRPSAAGRPCATAGRREDGHSQRRSLARPHIW